MSAGQSLGFTVFDHLVFTIWMWCGRWPPIPQTLQPEPLSFPGMGGMGPMGMMPMGMMGMQGMGTLAQGLQVLSLGFGV